jgi:hypothetical protein
MRSAKFRITPRLSTLNPQRSTICTNPSRDDPFTLGVFVSLSIETLL